MADLVDDDIVTDLGWEEYEFVIEIEIAFLGTTAPTAFLIADSDLANSDAVSRTIVLHKMMDAIVHESPGGFSVDCIEFAAAGAVNRTDDPNARNGRDHTYRSRDDSK